MKTACTMLALIVSLMIVGNVSAAEEKKADASKETRHVENSVMEMFNALNLTDEQKGKAQEISKEFGVKFKEAVGKMESILTAEQKAARTEAIKKAQAEGKTGPELGRAVSAAVVLTDEQKTKMGEATKEMIALQKDFLGKTMALLTPEQKNQLMKNMLEKSKKPMPKPN